MTDPRERFLPPELDLDDDDVVEAVEVVAEPGGDEPPEHGAEATPAPDAVAAPAPPRVSGFDGIGTRRESRERALALLYEAEQRGLTPPASVLDTLPVPAEPFVADLVAGVSGHLTELDELISRFSVKWPIGRMPAIDRALLRLGTYELAHTATPVGACISEAVELAKRYSTDQSHRFVNGMLSRIAEEVREVEAD